MLEGCGGELWSVGLVPYHPITYPRVVCRLYAKDSSQELMVPGVNFMQVLVRKGQCVEAITESRDERSTEYVELVL